MDMLVRKSLKGSRIVLGAVVLIVGWWVEVQALPQNAADRGTFVLRRGTDTVAIEHFVRSLDTLRGALEVKGEEGRLNYLVVLGPGSTVRSFRADLVATNAKPGDPPLQRVTVVVQTDTIIIESPSGIRRIPSTANAIPLIANSFGLTELATRRVRAQQGTASVAFVATRGVVLDAAFRAIGPDSLVMTAQGQEMRMRVDETGRILGATIPGPKLELTRTGGLPRR